MMKIGDMINNRSGLIYELRKINPKEGLPLLHRYLSVIKYNNTLIRGSGFSVYENQSKYSSVGESIERYCASIDKQLNIIKGVSGNSKDFINLENITRLTQNEYLNNNEFEDKNEQSFLYWVNGSSLVNNENKWMPYELVLLKTPPYKPIRDIISTGLSAHTSLEKAVIGGVCECIERDAFMLFWLFGRINFKVSLANVNEGHILKLKKVAEKSNLKIDIYDITTDLKVPTILTLVRREGKKGFYMGCSSNLNFRDAVIKSIEEGLGGYSIYIEALEYYHKKAPKSLEEIKTLEDHPLFYINGGYDEILNFFLTGKEIEIKEMPINASIEIEEVYDYFRKSNNELFYVDLTTKDVAAMGFKVVRVVAPTLAFLSVGVPLLKCKRIDNMKKEYGAACNLLPHPFP